MKKYESFKKKKIGFYCRFGSTAFGCILPDESEKLRSFFAEEKSASQKTPTPSLGPIVKRKS